MIYNHRKVRDIVRRLGWRPIAFHRDFTTFVKDGYPPAHLLQADKPARRYSTCQFAAIKKEFKIQPGDLL